MFRLKYLNILGSKAELAALPEGKLLINTINAHSYNTARKDELLTTVKEQSDIVAHDVPLFRHFKLLKQCFIILK